MAEAVKSEAQDPADIVEMLLGISILRFGHGQTAEEVAEGVSSSSDLKVEGRIRQRLSARLASLLTAESLVLIAKAIDLRQDQQRVFHTARILTDLRPIFSDDVNSPPVGTVAFHELKLEYYEDGDIRSIFVGLSEEDLNALSRAVERAQSKSAAIAKWTLGSDLRQIEPEAE